MANELVLSAGRRPSAASAPRVHESLRVRPIRNSDNRSRLGSTCLWWCQDGVRRVRSAQQAAPTSATHGLPMTQKRHDWSQFSEHPPAGRADRHPARRHVGAGRCAYAAQVPEPRPGRRGYRPAEPGRCPRVGRLESRTGTNDQSWYGRFFHFGLALDSPGQGLVSSARKRSMTCRQSLRFSRQC